MKSRILLLALVVFVCIDPVSATCFHTVLSQGSTTNANMCPTSDGSFYVHVNDQIKWTDQSLPTWVETSHLNFQCATDTAVITRSSGLFIDQTDEPWLDWSYYKVRLARRTTNAPGVLFVVSEQYSLSCPRVHPSPIVINFGSGGLQLTSPSSGVDFDVNSDGMKERVGWTRAGEDVAFLVHGASVTDGRQLFGNLSPQAPAIGDESENGYRALRLHDANSDGLIDANDPIWAELSLWFDWNHDGTAQPNEIRSLSAWNVTAIELKYKETGKKDGHGNLHRQRAKVRLTDGSWKRSTDFYPAQILEQWRSAEIVR